MKQKIVISEIDGKINALVYGLHEYHELNKKALVHGLHGLHEKGGKK